MWNTYRCGYDWSLLLRRVDPLQRAQVIPHRNLKSHWLNLWGNRSGIPTTAPPSSLQSSVAAPSASHASARQRTPAHASARQRTPAHANARQRGIGISAPGWWRQRGGGGVGDRPGFGEGRRNLSTQGSDNRPFCYPEHRGQPSWTSPQRHGQRKSHLNRMVIYIYI